MINEQDGLWSGWGANGLCCLIRWTKVKAYDYTSHICQFDWCLCLNLMTKQTTGRNTTKI